MHQTPQKHDRTTPRGWFSLFHVQGGWIATASALICIASATLSATEYFAAAKFDAVGVVTDAEAVERRKINSSRYDGGIYFVTYKFTVDEKIIQRERTVSSTQHDAAQSGSFHEIRYLPDDPRRFETYIGEAYDDALAMQWIAGFTGVSGLLTLLYFGWWTNRAIRARRHGLRIVAEVRTIVETRQRGRPSGDGYIYWRTADGVRGKSMLNPITKLKTIGRGGEIYVYVRKGYSVWEGDVGPQKSDGPI